MKYKKFLPNIILLIIGTFFSFYLINKLPAGQHYDQLRYIISPEQQILGLVENYSIRQIIANLLLFAYPAVYIVEYLRFIGAITLIPLIPKVVTALFFLSSLFIWKAILKELKFSVGAGWFFLILVATSGWFVIFGKFIPLLGGYLFYTSFCWYFFIKWGKTKKIIDLLMASLFLVFTTFTHIFSALLLPLSLFIYLALSVKRGSIKIKEVVSSGTVALASITIVTALIVYFIGLTGNSGIQISDSSLSGKDSSTIMYQLSLGEYSSAVSSYAKRMLFYMHPSFLVIGGLLQDTQTDTSFAFNDIKNPEFNHWQITGIGPFGLVAILIYFLPIFVRMPKNDKGTFFWALFIPYLLGSGFANFDNPSIARFLPYILWVPYIITVYLDTIVQIGLDLKKNLAIYVVILLGTLVSIVFSLNYLYSARYQQAEQQKFEMSYDEVFDSISKFTSMYADVYYIQDNRWNSQSYLEYYLSPTVINKTVLVQNEDFIKRNIINSSKRFVFIFKEKKYLELVSRDSNIATIIARDKDTGQEQYIAFSRSLSLNNSTKSCIEVDSTINEITIPRNIYIGEEEFLTPGFLPSYTGKLYSINLNDKDKSLPYKPIFAPVERKLVLPANRKNVSIFGTKNIMQPDENGAVLDYEFKVEQSGTYEIQVVSKSNEMVTGEILLRKGQERLPFSKFKSSVAGYSYTSSVSLEKDSDYVLSILAYRFMPVELRNNYIPELIIEEVSYKYLGETITDSAQPYILGTERVLENYTMQSPVRIGTQICNVIYSPSILVDNAVPVENTLSNLLGLRNATGSIRIWSIAPLYILVLLLAYALIGILFYVLVRLSERISE